jgi:starch phosphorylase
MKAALNGVPNLSVPDGWWLEGFDGVNGWMLGTAGDAGPGAARDAADAEALYRCLEGEVIPLFYDGDGDGVPTRWIAVMKRSIETGTPRFSARRMLKQYVMELYRPAGVIS